MTDPTFTNRANLRVALGALAEIAGDGEVSSGCGCPQCLAVQALAQIKDETHD